MSLFNKKSELPAAEEALPGRDIEMSVTNRHFVNAHPIKPPFPAGTEQIIFGLGCFWGAERKFWQLEGVYTTAVGYVAGFTPNPSYEEVCSGLTGHNEVVLVVYEAAKLEFEELLKTFWEAHNPTQGMRQGNDVGTQYRSGIYFFSEEQKQISSDSIEHYQETLAAAGQGQITTELLPAPTFYYAEDYHQQYLAKNPNGYCGLGGTGITYSPLAEQA